MKIIGLYSWNIHKFIFKFVIYVIFRSSLNHISVVKIKNKYYSRNYYCNIYIYTSTMYARMYKYNYYVQIPV